VSRDSSRSRGSKQKSHSSSRATSRASAATFDWVGDFGKKFTDDAKSREQRDADERTRLLEETRQSESKAFDQVTSQGQRTLNFMQDLVRKQNDLALQREKEIREDMKQRAASEALVAALERQLQAQAHPVNPQGDILTRGEQTSYFDPSPKSQSMPWCPSPVMRDQRVTSVPASVPRYDWYDFSLTPSSSFDDTSLCYHKYVCLSWSVNRHYNGVCC